MTHPHSRPSRLVDRHARADQAPEASNSGQDTSDLPPPAPGGATTTGVTKRTERGEEARAGQMSPAVAFIAGEARFSGTRLQQRREGRAPEEAAAAVVRRPPESPPGRRRWGVFLVSSQRLGKSYVSLL
jgi:hypothetical protein